jgi:DNA-binding Lrp family transcriptional regulator
MTGKEKIVNYLAKHGPMRDEDLARILNMSPSSARTRRHELELEGIVIAVGRTLTKYGGETWIWDIKK